MKILYSSYGEFNQHRVIGPAKWSHFDLLFIHEGEVSLTLGENSPVDLYQQQAVLIFPDTPFHGHSVSKTTKASVHHFTLPKPMPGEAPNLLERVKQKRNGFIFLDSKGDRQIERDLERSLRLAPYLVPEAMEATQQSLLQLCLIQLLYREYRVGPDPISSAQRALQETLDWLASNIHRPISLQEMASKAALSESHFRRLFRQHYGEGPVHYHQRIRMEEGQRMLRESTLPIKAISECLGFQDLAHFYRGFKKHSGTSPAEYRRSHRPIG